MNAYPVTDPSKLEMVLFDAGLIQKVPLAEIYDVKAGTSAQRASIDPEACRVKPDVHKPDDWGNELWANTRWEWFAYVLRDCQRVLDVGCGEGRPSLYLAHRLPEVVGCPGPSAIGGVGRSPAASRAQVEQGSDKRQAKLLRVRPPESGQPPRERRTSAEPNTCPRYSTS